MVYALQSPESRSQPPELGTGEGRGEDLINFAFYFLHSLRYSNAKMGAVAQSTFLLNYSILNQKPSEGMVYVL